MKIIAYAAKRYARATQRAVGRGTQVLTSPPLSDGSLDYAVFAGYDVVVFNLHGYWNIPSWAGDDGIIALKASTLATGTPISGGVFAINCWLGDGSPMLEALWRSGANWVVSGAELNYGGINTPVGADVLLRHFLRSLRKGLSPEDALQRAKRWTRWLAPRFTSDQRLALRDALEFEVRRE